MKTTKINLANITEYEYLVSFLAEHSISNAECLRKLATIVATNVPNAKMEIDELMEEWEKIDIAINTKFAENIKKIEK